MVSSVFKLFPLLKHSFTQNLSSFGPKLFLSTKSARNLEDKKLYTVNYLTTTFGFSAQKAHATSNLISFEKLDKPDSVVSFLNNHGFTKTQISSMALRFPQFLLSDPDKILLPKIEFLKSLGFSTKDVASVVFTAPEILHRSLEKHLKTTFIHNMEYLKELGVPKSNIMRFLKNQPRTFSQSHDIFRKIVDNVKKMTVNPEKYVFLWAIHAFVWTNKETWEKKMKVYVHWGFSEDDVFEAFRKQPHIMTHSIDKVTGVMNYLVNEMGFKSSIVIERPQILGLSLQKRIIPRCSVYRILSENKMVIKKLCIKQLLEIPEKKFLAKYVVPFKAQVPELLNLYSKYSSSLT